MTNDYVAIPLAPPRHAKSFRRVARWLLVLTAFVTPFFSLPITVDPTNINKFALVGFLAIAAFICFLGCVLEERKIEYPRSYFAAALLFFLAMQGVSTWFSVARSQSFFGSLATPDSFVSFVMYILLFFLFFFFFRREDIKKIGIALGAGSLIAIFTASSTPLGSWPAWGVLVGAIVAALAVIRPGEFTGYKKCMFFLSVAIALGALIFLNNSSLWLTVAIFIMAVAVLRFEPREHFQYAFVIITLALFFALIGGRLPISQKTFGDVQPTISASLAAAHGALQGPEVLTGSGPATFAYEFAEFHSPSLNATPYWANTFPQGHDFAITLFTTEGLVSFLLFMLMVIFAIQPFIHIHSLESGLAMMAAGSAFLLFALFLYPASFAELAMLFILLGMIHGATSRRSISFDAVIPWMSVVLSIVVMVAGATALAGAFVIGEKYAAAVLLGQANAATTNGDLAGAFAKANKAVALDPTDEYYRAVAKVLISEAKILGTSSSTSAATELSTVINGAVQASEKAVTENPQDSANWGNLGSVYETIAPIISGADTSAVNGYQKAAALDPANPQWDVDIARVFMESANLALGGKASSTAQQTDWANAESFLKKAIALKDDYANPRVLLVDLYLQEGNIAQAIQKVQELKQQNPLDSGVAFELGYLYYQNNQIDQAQEEFQVATILNPNYSNAHYFLGLIYDQKGMVSQALAEFQTIKSLNPGNQQVATIIANLQAGRPALANNVGSSTLSGQENSIALPNGNAPASVTKKGK